MLEPILPDEAARLRTFLAESGYDDARRLEAEELIAITLPERRRLPRLRHLTIEETPRNLLVRFFLLGDDVPATLARRLLPGWFLDLGLRAGLVRAVGSAIRGAIRLQPFAGLLVASDHFHAIHGPDADLLVLPLDPPAAYLLDFTLREPAATALDLGCGNGIQALFAARHCSSVTATDLNPRAIECARFNAALNGFPHVECAAGDMFAPVAGRRFDRIVTNPPFLMGPTGGAMWGFSGDPLDAFCRRLVREAPGHLAEGGILQMIFEWAEVEGEPWTDRLRGWYEESGCDVWLLENYRHSPEAYTERRVTEMPWSSAAADQAASDRWMDLFREHRVAAIHGGLLALRRRSGRPWVAISTHHERPRGPFGAAVRRAFAARDLLTECGLDADLLARRVRLAEGAVLTVEQRARDERWNVSAIALTVPDAPAAPAGLDPEPAAFLARLDGRVALREAIAGLSVETGLPMDRLVPQVLGLVRELLARGFVVPV